ncbi:MAG: hypothetical protein IJC68_04940 [Firmicutes bacterium]|nr:hypothetical protein [Bacillota bacterium]
MSKVRIALLILLALGMLVTAIATWGSVGSITMVMCLILMGLNLLHRYFLYRDDPGDFEMDV